MENVAAHEAELTAYALQQMQQLPGLTIYGDTDPHRAGQRLGVIPFNLEGMSHFQVAAILGHEFGIGVRNGCFCAHPYIFRLLDVAPDDMAKLETRLTAGDRRQNPGLVRASFGLYNTRDEVDVFVSALDQIVAGTYQGHYRQDPASGDFVPNNWLPDFADYFTIT